MGKRPLGLFQGYGIELEYMIVDRETLKARPVCDQLLASLGGDGVSDFENGEAAWSNELVMHVIEYKTNGPAPKLAPLPALFAEQVRLSNEKLAALGAMVMPTAMHPLFDPEHETTLWPHENGPVYQTYDRIFSCKGHGWSNLQSMHINLPFADDAEFARLHSAIRMALPMLPALCASSPIVEGVATGISDSRLDAYKSNARRIPSITGVVIPEALFTQAEYEQRLLQRMYRDIAPYDPEGTIQKEFLNSRGAIARFDRMAIEIRVIDVQESALADIAVASLVVGLVRGIAEERWAKLSEIQHWDTGWLAHVFNHTTRHGRASVIQDVEYLRALGWRGGGGCTAADFWRHLAKNISFESDELRDAALRIVEKGSLSDRILRALDVDPLLNESETATGGKAATPKREKLLAVYRELCDCLATNRLFRCE